MTCLYLAIAIVAEVIATSFLKSTEGFSKLWPSVLVILGYATAFYFLSLTLRAMSVGIVYAIWCGLGIILVALIAWLIFGQKLDLPAVLGMALIIAGVAVINVFSASVCNGWKTPRRCHCVWLPLVCAKKQADFSSLVTRHSSHPPP